MSSPKMNIILEMELQKYCLEGTSHKLPVTLLCPLYIRYSERFIMALNKINYLEALRDTYLHALTCLLAV